MKASGFDEIWTLDLHSEQHRKLFPIAVLSLFPCSIFRESLTGHGLNGACFVSTDQGAIPRCQTIMPAAGMKFENLVYFEKQRTERGTVHQSPIGKVQRCAVIVDDIHDTGTTLVSACEKLVAAGGDELYTCVTHGLFTGEQWHNL